MSLLLITLPPGPPGSYAFATSTDGQTLSGHGSAAASLLPAAGRGVEVVAVVPAAQLSWHRVDLPKGAGGRWSEIDSLPDLVARIAGSKNALKREDEDV